MRAHDWRWVASVAGLGWAAALAACPARAPDPPIPGDTVVVVTPPDTVILTAAEPRAAVPLDLQAIPHGTTAAEVPLVRVENPDGQAFSVRLWLTWDDPAAPEGRGGVILGTVAPHPADRVGRFTLGVQNAIREAQGAMAAAPGARTSVLLELLPVAADRPLRDPLHIHVAPLRWYRAG